jgi:hypothetical protein
MKNGTRARIALRSAALLLAYIALPSAANAATCYNYHLCEENWGDDQCYTATGAGGPSCTMSSENECFDEPGLCGI